ncbi:hypothetical protein BLA60_17700 [Actinophytocola xinjiangensis]|uniref:DUF3558 domain-containing protein n=1 Tax=Actinophytocola xinjiangensis TaxID=485602 RepID=A0A7Z1AXH4_9PSEU|nr:hypothetical protein [Actinophytocola xinjiangensis]OLF10266.1 hypothetical protein BLA60_17700 [Actinophytocola xinjiangensis]
MGVRLTMAGIGMCVALVAGCGAVTAGEASPSASPEGEAAGTTELPDLTGQQVCDLLSAETLAKYTPDARISNGTVQSTESVKQALCQVSATDGNNFRFLTVEVNAVLTVDMNGDMVDGTSAETAASDWLASQRAGKPDTADLNGVGDEGFTTFVVDEADGRTEASALFRGGMWGVKAVYHGGDRPNPDDRDNKVYLTREVLIAALTEVGTEIATNLPSLTSGGATTAPDGDLSGDMLCETLSEALIDRYLPKPKTGTSTSSYGMAECRWNSAVPRPDSPGLRLRNASVTVSAVAQNPEGDYEKAKQDAQEDYADGPDKDGPSKGATAEAPVDLPDLGTAAFLVVGHSLVPSTSARITVLLPGSRLVVITYGGGDAAELDTGDGNTNLGEPAAITTEEATEAAKAMAKEVLSALP